MGNRGVSLRNIDEAWRFCEAIAKSGVAPKGMNETAKIFAVVQAGAELGLTPFRALSNMKIINGRVGPMGSLAKALVRKEKALAPGTGFKQDFVGEEGTDEYAARVITLRVGESEEYVTTFSVKDAKLAKLWDQKQRDGSPGVWMKYPKRMLMWRAVGFHMDDYYSDVIMGMPIAELLEDYPEARIPVVMEQKDVPVVDPLLAELTAIGETMQPPTAAEIAICKTENVDPETGEYLGNLGQATPSESPLSKVMAEKEAEAPPMSEEEAMADLIREGIVKEEDLAEPDSNNAAPEGDDQKVLF
jgi:hypothetical protein